MMTPMISNIIAKSPPAVSVWLVICRIKKNPMVIRINPPIK